jgi:hypothetical protein
VELACLDLELIKPAGCERGGETVDRLQDNLAQFL